MVTAVLLPAGMTGKSGSSARMDAAPVLGDLAASADPHAVTGGNVIEECDQPGDPAEAAGQAVVQRQRHQLGVVRTFLVHHLEAIDHVASEVLAGREAAVFVKP